MRLPRQGHRTCPTSSRFYADNHRSGRPSMVGRWNDPRFNFETHYRTTGPSAPRLRRPRTVVPTKATSHSALGTDGSPSRPRTRESRVRTRTPPPLHLKLNLNLNLNLIPHPSSSSHQPSRTWRPWREINSHKTKRAGGSSPPARCFKAKFVYCLVTVKRRNIRSPIALTE